MIEGVLRHCTDMEIQRQYVDSHGQSAVGFAFCRLLGFELAPRLKAVARQKLALPQAGMRTRLSNLLRSSPARSTGTRSSNNMTKWSNMPLPCNRAPPIRKRSCSGLPEPK